MNFKFKRVFAVIMRHFLAMTNPFKLINQLYWVGLDITIFGFMSKAMSSPTGTVVSTATLCLLANLSLWYIIPRAAIGMALTLFEDLMDASFVGLMATPLTIIEWTLAQVLIGLLCSVINFAMGFMCIRFFFGFNIFSIGGTVVPIIISLILSSWILGIFLVSFLMFFGKKAATSIYSIAWVLIPFSGVFYSVKMLPQFCQSIAKYIPMYYIFDGLTQLIKNGTDLSQAIVMSLILNMCYLFAAIAILVLVFKFRKKTGLTRLELEG